MFKEFLIRSGEVIAAVVIAIAIFALLLFFSSCSKVVYPQETNTTEKDSTGFIPYSKPIDSVSLLLSQLVECRNGKPFMNPSSVIDNKGNALNANIDTTGILHAKFTKNPDIIKTFIPIVFRSKVSNSIIVKQTNILTGFQKFCVKWFWITSSLLVVFAAFKVITKIYQSRINSLLNRLTK